MKNLTSENRREVTKIVHEWNSHLEIFSRPRVIENQCRQYLLLRTDLFNDDDRRVPLSTLLRGVEE